MSMNIIFKQNSLYVLLLISFIIFCVVQYKKIRYGNYPKSKLLMNILNILLILHGSFLGQKYIFIVAMFLNLIYALDGIASLAFIKDIDNISMNKKSIVFTIIYNLIILSVLLLVLNSFDFDLNKTLIIPNFK